MRTLTLVCLAVASAAALGAEPACAAPATAPA
jgi:hypothetical protein